MPTIIKDMILDVSKKNRIQDIAAKQYDQNSRYLKGKLVDNGRPLTVEAGASVFINATRGDGVSRSFAGEVCDDGCVLVPLTYWMLELDGRVSCDITVDTGASILSTLGFTVAVERSNRPPAVATPTITLDGDLLHITDESGMATAFDILADGEVKTATAETTFDLSTLRLTAGRYAVTVRAKAEGFPTSAASQAVIYTALEAVATPSISLDGDLLGIYDEGGVATAFDILVDGEVRETVNTPKTLSGMWLLHETPMATDGITSPFTCPVSFTTYEGQTAVKSLTFAFDEASAKLTYEFSTYSDTVWDSTVESHGGWNTGGYHRMMNFGDTPQVVDEALYQWITANAQPVETFTINHPYLEFMPTYALDPAGLTWAEFIDTYFPSGVIYVNSDGYVQAYSLVLRHDSVTGAFVNGTDVIEAETYYAYY